MSTQNIKQIVPVEGGVIVVFETHSQGDLSYFYSIFDGAEEIMNGADPAPYNGVRM